MFNNIFRLLSQYGVRDIVLTIDISIDNAPINIRKISDIRSASFEALGIERIIERPVAVLVDERYVSNTLSAITEIWFQRKDIIVVLVNCNLYKHLDYLDRCFASQSMFLNNSNINDILSVLSHSHGPHLIRTDVVIDDNSKINYTPILSQLDSLLDRSAIVKCYNLFPINNNYNFTLVNILPEHKYCMVSKYVGFLLGTDNRAILCIPEELLAYDSNIFNFRDISDSFFLIVIKDASSIIKRITPWIISNNIRFIESDAPDYKALLNTRQKTVLYINKEYSCIRT